MVDIKAIFSFVGDNPPTALITGGILCLLLGGSLHLASPGSGGLFLIIGGVLVALGVILYIIELEER